MHEADAVRCRCRGTNGECAFCFGSGYITDEPKTSKPTLLSRTIQPGQNRIPSNSPSRQKANVPGRKLDLHAAIIRHGRNGNDERDARKLIRLLDIAKSRSKLEDGNPTAYAELGSKVAKCLRMERAAFQNFVNVVVKSASILNSNPSVLSTPVNLALGRGGGQVRFTADDMAQLAGAYVVTLPKRDDPAATAKLMADHALDPKSKEPKANDRLMNYVPQRLRDEAGPKPTPKPTPQRVKATDLLVIAALELKDIDIASINREVSKKWRYVYFAGPKKSIKLLEGKFPFSTFVHVSNPANAEGLKTSSSVKTIILEQRTSPFAKQSPDSSEPPSSDVTSTDLHVNTFSLSSSLDRRNDNKEPYDVQTHRSCRNSDFHADGSSGSGTTAS